jgi:hypothetical protein
MNNPLHILQTLDRHLTKPAEITIFGRAALALGFPNSPATFATTHNVDAILPLAWLAAEDQNLDCRSGLHRCVPETRARPPAQIPGRP